MAALAPSRGAPLRPSAGTSDQPTPFLGAQAIAPVLVPRWITLAGLAAAQVVFARLLMQAPILGLAQTLAVVGLALWAAVKRQTLLTLGLIAYVPAMEIGLRQARSPVPYLIAPYLLIAMAGLAIFTVYRNVTRPGRVALIYLFLLMPSCAITIATTGTGARELIAFALAGPVSFALLIVLTSQLIIEPWLYRRLLWILIISGMTPLAISVFSVRDTLAVAGSVDFGDESNFVATGGFGPVQVSSLLGLSVLACVLVVLVERSPGPRALAILIGAGATVMCFLTFSRGGMLSVVLASVTLALTNARNPRDRIKILVMAATIVFVVWNLLVPALNDFTNGAFDTRFSDTKTGRTDLARNDLDLFVEHPLVGVGPGLTKYNRLSYEVCNLRADLCRDEGSSHTEFTRMLGEHGVAGLLAIGCMIALAFLGISRAGVSRPITLTIMTWAIAQMFYANFRISAVAVMFAFAFLRIRQRPLDEVVPPTEPEPVGGRPFPPVNFPPAPKQGWIVPPVR